jgi:hypothetical protein
MSLTAILAAVLVALAAAGGAYLQGRHDGRDAQLAEAVRDEAVAAIAADAAASAIAANISRVTVMHQTVRQELEREIVEKPVYRDGNCRTGADSLQRFNAALPGSASAASVAGAVSAAHASD